MEHKLKQITIISGKGGTGKTTLTANLGFLQSNIVLADCDVDASNLHLLLSPNIKEKYNFYSGTKYSIDKENCIKCNKCINLCNFQAIDINYNINKISCEKCGLCYNVCPNKSILEEQNCTGEYYISKTKNNLDMVHAKLNIAEDNSGKLVTQVRKEAIKIAKEKNLKLILIDGPPGIGCTLNASITGIDLAVIVTEPTLSGIHDLERIIETTNHFQIPSSIIINKYNINFENTKKIENIGNNFNIPCVGKIPYDTTIIDSLIKGKTIVEDFPNHNISQIIIRTWKEITTLLI
jgi:MinD superfamily P-loop ATPase